MRTVTSIRLKTITATGLAIWLWTGHCLAAAITLQNSFIKQYANRATMTANCVIDHAHPKPNPPIKDGDLHIAVRSNDIRLPAVAEIMNAASEPAALNLVKVKDATDQPVQIKGAWRLWCEHPGTTPQVQGRPVTPAKNTNPDHVFEIHPISSIGNITVLESFKPIAGYKPYPAEKAFARYERLNCKITPGVKTTTIETPKAIYNYAEFVIRPTGALKSLPDGSRIQAHVLADNGKVVAKRPMVFVKASPPERAIRNLPKNRTMHVLGVPRIFLENVLWRSQMARKGKRQYLTAALPYEMIVAAAYNRSSHERNK
jgi:hypothetical protein